MKATRRYASALLALTIIVSACSGKPAEPAAPAAEPVGIDLRTARPSYPAGELPELSIVLRNGSTHDCSLPSTSVGAVEILSVQLDGAAVIGIAGTDYFYDGIEAVVAAGLRTVAPGESITVPLDVQRTRDGQPRIVSTVATESGSGTTTAWPLDQPGQYRVTAALAVTSRESDCAPTGATADVAFEVTR